MMRITFVGGFLLFPVLLLAEVVLFPFIGFRASLLIALSLFFLLVTYATLTAESWAIKHFKIHPQLSSDCLTTYRWVWNTHANVLGKRSFSQAPRLVLTESNSPNLLVTKGLFGRGLIIVSRGLYVRCDETMLRQVFLDALLIAQSEGLWFRSTIARLIGIGTRCLGLIFGRAAIEQDLRVVLSGASVEALQLVENWKTVVRLLLVFCLMGWGRVMMRIGNVKDLTLDGPRFNQSSYTSLGLDLHPALTPMLRVALVDSSMDLVSWF